MLRDRLHSTPPFAIDLSHVEPDLTGWGSTHPVFAAAIRALRPSLVIEVGTWKGGSAIHMGQVMRDEGLLGEGEGEIVCVDTWLGAPIAWTSEPALKPQLRLHGGYPQLFYTFARNVVDAGLEGTITPLPASSDGGHAVLKHFGAEADLIYIDADHDYGPAKCDFEHYLALLSPAGMMVGDDFGCFPGVTRAGQEFAEEQNLHAVKLREKIVFSREPITQRLGLEGDGYYERAAA